MWLSLITSLLPSVIGLIQAIPNIKAAWDAAPTKSLDAVAAAIPPALVAQLAEVGSQLFPKLSPEIQAAAAALVVAHPNATSYVQSGLNLIASTGYFTLSPALRVDGVYGPKTKAAVEAFQAKAGLPVTGFAADAEQTAIAALLNKIG